MTVLRVGNEVFCDGQVILRHVIRRRYGDGAVMAEKNPREAKRFCRERERERLLLKVGTQKTL